MIQRAEIGSPLLLDFAATSSLANGWAPLIHARGAMIMTTNAPWRLARPERRSTHTASVAPSALPAAMEAG